MPHAPVASQVWTPLFEHCVVFGVQAPEHAPETHACVVHGTGVPNIPSASHPCTALPEHCFWVEVHVPVHWPALHALLPHATAGDHWPVLSQVWTPAPRHCVAPGAQTPEHAPAVQPWFAHGVALPQAPFALHVCTPLPEHCVAPGAQLPMQPPSTQAALPQSRLSPHWPAAVQTWTPLPEHRVVLGTHTLPASAPPSWPASSFVAPTVESLAASSALSPFASRSPPASLLPVSDPPAHAATTAPQKIETESSRMARPLIMIAPLRRAPHGSRTRPRLTNSSTLCAGRSQIPGGHE